MKKALLKRIAAALLLLAAAAALCACGGAKGTKEEKAVPGEYRFTFTDADGKGIEGVSVQLCTDKMCKIVKSDADGKAVYTVKPDDYEVHIARIPDGYVFDGEKEFKVDEDGCIKTFVLKKN